MVSPALFVVGLIACTDTARSSLSPSFPSFFSVRGAGDIGVAWAEVACAAILGETELIVINWRHIRKLNSFTGNEDCSKRTIDGIGIS